MTARIRHALSRQNRRRCGDVRATRRARHFVCQPLPPANRDECRRRECACHRSSACRASHAKPIQPHVAVLCRVVSRLETRHVVTGKKDARLRVGVWVYGCAGACVARICGPNMCAHSHIFTCAHTMRDLLRISPSKYTTRPGFWFVRLRDLTCV